MLINNYEEHLRNQMTISLRQYRIKPGTSLNRSQKQLAPVLVRLLFVRHIE